jgi:ribosome-binding protein aMBF1 (putative translation factor)
MDPVCPVVAAAKRNSGLSYAQIGEKIGQPENKVIDMVSSRNANSSTVEDLARALGIKDSLPKDSTHGR